MLVFLEGCLVLLVRGMCRAARYEPVCNEMEDGSEAYPEGARPTGRT